MNVQPQKASYFISTDLIIQYCLHVSLFFIKAHGFLWLGWISEKNPSSHESTQYTTISWMYLIIHTKLRWIDLTVMWIGRVCRAHLLHWTRKQLESQATFVNLHRLPTSSFIISDHGYILKLWIEKQMQFGGQILKPKDIREYTMVWKQYQNMMFGWLFGFNS